MRLFVALELAAPVCLEIGAWLERIRDRFPSARWVDPTRLHLTLRFLSEVADRELSELRAGLRSACGKAEVLSLAVGGGGAFPGVQRASVLWLGVATDGDLKGVHELASLAVTEALGVEAERRVFHAHVTLARCRPAWRRARVECWLETVPARFGAAFAVTEAVLMRSELGSGGPRYSVVDRFALGETGA
ncbi:MAG: RNA 2',3'-cyclic phosphodiesterase [Acidobacteria bacterium]|nr:RNA 2',3'-cyclic phosphodiesterase [Acidobacteriota bacterium]